MKTIKVLYILSNGKVAAINKKDGSIVWEIKLKTYVGKSLNYSIGQITVEDDKLYIGVTGILICLNTKDGSLVWLNELKGWGYGFVSIGNAGNESNGAQSMQNAQAAAIVATTVATTG